MKALSRQATRCLKRRVTTSCSDALPLGVLQARSLLHTSPAKYAEPINHPPAPGPPPKPPTAESSVEQERVLRKKKQAELVEKGKNLRTTPAKPASVLQKRFWKQVTVEETPDGYQIFLDARPVRTPSRHALTIPLTKRHLATAIALEWDLLVSAHQATKQHYVPLTSLTVRAIQIADGDLTGDDRVRESVVRMLMGYLTTDTLLCWAPEKTNTSHPSGMTLRAQQKAVAGPIIEFLKSYIWPSVELLPALGEDSILPIAQPEKTEQVVQSWIKDLPAWELAALERAVLASKSLCVAVRLLADWSGRLRSGWMSNAHDDRDIKDVHGKVHAQRFTVEDAADACSLEVRWQTGMWGEVEDTHDVEREDIRRQLGSVVLLVSEETT